MFRECGDVSILEQAAEVGGGIWAALEACTPIRPTRSGGEDAAVKPHTDGWNGVG